MQPKFMAIATAVLSASQAQAQLSAADVVKDIEGITSLVADTNKIASALDPANVLADVPKLINNFRDIISTVAADVTSIGDLGNSNFTEEQQAKICDTFSDFVEGNQKLLNTISENIDVLSATPLTALISAVLVLLESGVDSLAFGIIDVVPTCQDLATDAKSTLEKTLESVIDQLS